MINKKAKLQDFSQLFLIQTQFCKIKKKGLGYFIFLCLGSFRTGLIEGESCMSWCKDTAILGQLPFNSKSSTQYDLWMSCKPC